MVHGMNIRFRQGFRYLCWLALIPCVSAPAQTTAPITFDFEVDYVLGLTVNNYSGTGTISPFGNASAVATETFPSPTSPIINSSFTISSGDTFNATAGEPSIGSSGACMIVSTITGGTGIFAGATGSFTLSYTCANGGARVGTAHFTGTGSITTISGSTSVSPGALGFSFLEGGPKPASQPVFLSNQTAQAITFFAGSDQNWLSVSPAKVTTASFSVTTLTVTASTAGLTPGTYAGTVNVAMPGHIFTITVTLTISTSQQELVLSHSALEFQVAKGAAPPPSQSIVVLNPGSGSLKWTAAASSLSGSWLSVSPSSGAAGDSAVVTVNPANLLRGTYYGIVQFTANGASNSPQTAVVVLNVVPATSIVISLEPTALIFVASQAASANPAPETITVANSSNEAVSFTAAAVSPQAGLFSVNPASATVSSASPAQLTITANVSGLAPGQYSGTIELQFADGSTGQAALLLIVTPSSSAAVRAGSTRNAAAAPAACTPSKLLPVSTALSENFNATAAWPTALQVTVVDDCGSPMGPGNVTGSFSTGDPPLAMASLGSGQWSGTWQPSFTTATTPVVITVTAQSSLPVLTGVALIAGTLQPNTATPAISPNGVVSTASYAPNAPLAPGAFASIFGNLLATSTAQAGALPFGTELGGAQVIVGGQLVPIQYSSGGQINILLPYGLTPDSTQQLIVQQGLTYSTPQSITIAPAQPAVFTQDQSGHGPAVITVVKPNGVQFNADASHPASAGDALVIYCSGLGAVNLPVAAGSASPQSPAAKIANPIAVTIGGITAPVSFAGLSPNLAGLYQVNVTVPSGITPGPSVPVSLTMGALSSPPVTIAIQ
jgi:uncharacterized protein (TIGR03437 family)